MLFLLGINVMLPVSVSLLLQQIFTDSTDDGYYVTLQFNIDTCFPYQGIP